MKKYKVFICFSGCAEYEIEANSRDEAIDMAVDMADVTDCECWDIDFDSIEDMND